MPQGNHGFEVCPPPGELLLPNEVAGVVVNANTSLGVIQLQPEVLLSGTVLSHLGAAVQGVNIDLRLPGTPIDVLLRDGSTDAQGQYFVVVPTGNFDVVFNPPYTLPLAADIHPSVIVAGNTNLDCNLPPCPFFTTVGTGRPGRRPPPALEPIPSEAPPSSLRLEDAERAAILRALEAAGQRKDRAAKLLGISHTGLYGKLDRLGL